MNERIESYLDGLKKGDRRSFSRLLSLVESRGAHAVEILKEIAKFSQRKPRLGITGPAGAGKSTLVDQLITHYRQEEKKVGVIAVDPSSPYTGGAVLGDRIRMQKHSGDEDVYIRSVGSRGRSGGVSFATRAFIQLFESFGIDELLLETVGAGQSETAVVNLVDTTVVVLVPEAGDAIQALKAGMLEIADIYVVNKKDRAGADQLVHEIESMLSLGNNKLAGWKPPVLMTQAQMGEGIDTLIEHIRAHQAFISKDLAFSPDRAYHSRHRELLELMAVIFERDIEQLVEGKSDLQNMLRLEKDPNMYELSETLLREYRNT